jgi:hypothetical protein
MAATPLGRKLLVTIEIKADTLKNKKITMPLLEIKPHFLNQLITQ